VLDLLVGQVTEDGQLDLVFEILLLCHRAFAILVTQGAQLSQQVHREVADGDINALHLLHIADEVIFAGADHLWIIEEGVQVINMMSVRLFDLYSHPWNAGETLIQAFGDLARRLLSFSNLVSCTNPIALAARSYGSYSQPQTHRYRNLC